MRGFQPYAAILSLLAVASLVQGQKCDSNGVCDKLPQCTQWKEDGTCEKNKSYMLEQCPVSCKEDDCKDLHVRCPAWSKIKDECVDNPDMRKFCQKSCDTCDDEVQSSSSLANASMMEEDVMPCVDENENCRFWADKGECVANPGVRMNANCARSCTACGGATKKKKKASYPTTVSAAMVDDATTKEVDEDEIACVDQHEDCNFWAEEGECTANPGSYTSCATVRCCTVDMNENCAKSCNTCDKIKKQKPKAVPSFDSSKEILEESANFGEKQVANGGERKETVERVKATIDYMNSEKVANLSGAIRESCLNRHELCAFWAILGECEANQAYMIVQCAPSCYSCHLIDINERCPIDPNAVPGLEPGSLNKMFERIVSTAPGNRTLTDEEREELQRDEMPEYTVTVLSRPSEDPATEISAKIDRLPPWVIVFDNFITDEECEALVQLGYKHEYKRSADVGKIKFDGTFDSFENSRRTSENAWCSEHLGCRNETVPTRMHNRISKVLDIPPENGEDLQILKYEKGQFYRTHHDFIAHQVDRPCGPRILTFFLYLSDVEDGGGTDFPDLGITVDPKKGRALLWPSVYDSDPKKDDPRMRHQALPVKEGTKFAANSWIHLYDYKKAADTGCH